MDIVIRITGGYVAIPRTITIDTRSMKDDMARSCENDALACLDAVPGRPDPCIRDGRIVTIEADGRSATFHEPDLPGPLHPLLRMKAEDVGVSVRIGTTKTDIEGDRDGRQPT